MFQSKSKNKKCVWTAQAWSNCMYGLFEKRSKKELKSVICLPFGRHFAKMAECPKGAKGVAQWTSMSAQQCPKGAQRCPRVPI